MFKKWINSVVSKFSLKSGQIEPPKDPPLLFLWGPQERSDDGAMVIIAGPNEKEFVADFSNHSVINFAVSYLGKGDESTHESCTLVNRIFSIKIKSLRFNDVERMKKRMLDFQEAISGGNVYSLAAKSDKVEDVQVEIDNEYPYEAEGFDPTSETGSISKVEFLYNPKTMKGVVKRIGNIKPFILGDHSVVRESSIPTPGMHIRIIAKSAEGQREYYVKNIESAEERQSIKDLLIANINALSRKDEEVSVEIIDLLPPGRNAYRAKNVLMQLGLGLPWFMCFSENLLDPE